MHTRKTIYTYIILIIVMVSICSCTGYVDIKYTPEAGVSRINGADLVNVSINTTDTRAINDKVSSAENAFGTEIFTIISNNGLTELISNAIEYELTNRGFRICDGGVRVNIELKRFFAEFQQGMWTSSYISVVTMYAQVVDFDDTVNYNRYIVGTCTQKGLMSYYATNAARTTLEKALKNAISDLMQDSRFICALKSSI